MKKYLLIFTLASLFCCMSCGKASNEMSPDYPTDYQVTYGLGKVLQYDPMNINGIDIVKKLDFFKTLRLTVYFVNSHIAAAEFVGGDVPFSTYDFNVPTGKFECVLDTSALPNALRIKDTDHVIAYYMNGDLMVPFQLDSQALRYEYIFQNLE